MERLGGKRFQSVFRLAFAMLVIAFWVDGAYAFPTAPNSHTRKANQYGKLTTLAKITTIESELPFRDAHRLLWNYWGSKHNIGDHQIPNRLASRMREPR